MSNRLFFHEFSPRKVWKSQKSVPPNVKNEASDHLKGLVIDFKPIGRPGRMCNTVH